MTAIEKLPFSVTTSVLSVLDMKLKWRKWVTRLVLFKVIMLYITNVPLDQRSQVSKMADEANDD